MCGCIKREINLQGGTLMGITNSGKAEMSNLFGNVSSPTAFTYLALGSTATAFTATQTALVAEITGNGLARASATVTQETTTVTDDTTQLTKQWTASGTETVREAGVFNASSSGTMAARKVLGTAQALVSGNTFTWTHSVIFA